jgi:hypothetical protein
MSVATAVGGARTRALSRTTLLRLTLAGAVLWEIGGNIDAWYHLSFGFEVETFFTWPHALLYGAWALVGVLGLIGTAGERDRGLLRAGYPMVLLGAFLFGLGGPVDYVWHSLVGFEVSLEALLAPSHLWLAFAFAIAQFGVLQVALIERARRGANRAGDLPVMIALALLFRVALWNLWYSEPLSVDYASAGALSQGLHGFAGIAWQNPAAAVAGAAGLVLHSVLLALFLVGGLRWLRLSGGAVAIVMLWNALLVTAATDKLPYLAAVALAALVGEAIWARVRAGRLGGPDGRVGYWVLGAAVPAVLFAAYFAVMAAVGGGIAWTTHLWAGAPFLAGLYGLIVALLVAPPRSIVAEGS